MLTVGTTAKQTARFAEMFDNFFDYLNGSSRSAEMLSRNPFNRSPHKLGNDWKLKVHADKRENTNVTDESNS